MQINKSHPEPRIEKSSELLGAKLIALSNGMYAIVDEQDFDWLSSYKWQAHVTSAGKCYPRSTQRIHKTRKNKILKMHRLIMGVEKSSLHVDHINRNPLDNRRSNLRICLPQQNNINCVSRKHRIGLRGVRERANKKWQAKISVNGKVKHLGTFPSARIAIEAYNAAAVKFHREFAVLNELS